MKSDILMNIKAVHVKLRKEQHTALRIRLMNEGLTMQDFFEEFVRTYLEERISVVNVVKAMQVRKAEERLEEAKASTDQRRNRLPQPNTSELDIETLYGMLENQKTGTTG